VRLEKVQVGDTIIVDMPTIPGPIPNSSNSGSFKITALNVSEGYVEFNNLLGIEVTTFSHAANPNSFVRFVSPQKSVVYVKNNRAMVWEVRPGEIVVEMPATPPVVNRELIGASHLNGPTSTVVQLNPNRTSMTLFDIKDWPSSGHIVLEPKYEIQGQINVGSVVDKTSSIINGCYDISSYRYTYTGINKDTNELTGITPELPRESGILEANIVSIERIDETVTVVTDAPHYMKAGQSFSIVDCVGPNFNGTWNTSKILSETSFEFRNIGGNDTGSGGFIRSEYMGLLNSGSKVYLMSSIIETDVFGPYVYEFKGQYVLSSYVGTLNQDIVAGNVYFNLEIDEVNNIPAEPSIIYINYGLSNQEGPIRVLSKPTDKLLFTDPSYIFTKNHSIGSQITVIRRKGAIVLDPNGSDFAAYITDPQQVRIILQKLIESVKSAGTYLNYIVRFPNVLYSDFDLYKETEDPLD
jgi:hypothetical protein